MINFSAMRLWEVRRGRVMGLCMHGLLRGESGMPEAFASCDPYQLTKIRQLKA
jgi:hypothetical protein